ncbi:MAG: putative toxin-antitoxin system toxin component, PIN family [Bacteroidales bacterium]|nr:putative toxin-antitoxin system toxin component, PIN family [Bacteroidales bacterium]
MKQYYAVFDTNVLVSALLSRNTASPTVALLDHTLDRTIIPIYNEEILNEYNEVLHRAKFSFATERIAAVIAAIRSGIAADRTPASWNFPDEEDIVFYEVALSVDEAYLITGNIRHFPSVSKVVTPAEMLRIISKR